MSAQNFVPEIWDAALLLKLRDELVYAQPGMINRNYEGDVARAGDTVYVTTPKDVKVRSYTKNAGVSASAENNSDGAIAGIQYDLTDTAAQTITVNQSDYFAIMVDDIDRRQKLPGFVEAHVANAARALAEATDDYVVGVMTNGVPVANQLGSVTVARPEEAYELLVELRTKMQRGKAPRQGRWVVVPPELYAKLLQDDRFIRNDAAGTTAGLRNGVVGEAAGFTVIESNTVPEAGGEFTVLAGH